MIITDLDGTLFKSDHTCGQDDYRTLLELGDTGHIRVIATGRSLHSAHKVLPPDFPIDYLIFSSGAGLMDWKRKKLLLTHSLTPNEVTQVGISLKKRGLDFMIQYPIPENHHFLFHRTSNPNIDFERRIKVYKGFASELTIGPEAFGRATQFIAIVCKDALHEYENIKNEFKNLKVIRATSPLDHQSIWIEIFPKAVSKGQTAMVLCDKLNLSYKSTIGIGNDFNDIDLLGFTYKSAVVENAPIELKETYPISTSNNNSGFSNAVQLLFPEF